MSRYHAINLLMGVLIVALVVLMVTACEQGPVRCIPAPKPAPVPTWIDGHPEPTP